MKRLLAPLVILTTVCFVLPPAEASTPPARAHRTTRQLIPDLLRLAPGLRPEVLKLALDASAAAAKKGLVKRQELLTVIDYSLPSSQPRLWVFNLETRKVLFKELVAHGKNSGENRTTFFSNAHGSLATSMGLFVTADTYIGENGYSLRLKGLEAGINDSAFDRLIVMHGAKYVSEAAVRAMGRIGRSWGCPAVRREVAQKIIDTVRGGSPIFAFYPEKKWLSTSTFLASSQETVTPKFLARLAAQ